MKISKIKLSAVISYFTIAFNIISGLIYTPWMIENIGQGNYGLYILATSLITMFAMDFGMGAAVTRFLSKYNAERNQDAVDNFLGLVYKLYLAIDAVILSALVVVFFFIDKIYVNLTLTELQTFNILYLIVGAFTVISFPFTTLNGILTAHEKFVELKICDLFNKVFVIIAMVIALSLGGSVYSLVVINAVAGLLTIALKYIIIKAKTKVKANFKFFEKRLLKEIFGFSMWTTITAVMQKLIINITPSIIVAVSKTATTGSAIFGLASTIEGYVYMFANAINGMFMPRISKIIHDNKKDSELMPLMIKIGRIQCMIIGILVVGFISLGRPFITDIWNKPDFYESYICAILLIIPSFFYLPMQIANTTLIVENKVKLQAYVFVIMGIVNFSLSLILSKYYGAIGASLSIFIAYMLRTILMALIYEKHLKLDMKSFFKNTFVKIIPYLIITLVLGMMCEKYNPISGVFFRFGVNVIFIVFVFCIQMYFFFMNSYEKSMIKNLLIKFKKNKEK